MVDDLYHSFASLSWLDLPGSCLVRFGLVWSLIERCAQGKTSVFRGTDDEK